MTMLFKLSRAWQCCYSSGDAIDWSAMSRPRWARWLTAISLGVALVALVITVRNTGVGTILHYLRRIGWWWLLVVPMEIANTTLDATAIRALASPDKPRLRTTLLAQLAGRAVNAVTPMGNLGEGVKMSVLTDVVSESRSVATILLYNIISFSVELLIFAAAVPVLLLLVPMPTGFCWLVIITGIGCIAITTGMYMLVRRGVVASMVRFLARLPIPVLSPWLARRYPSWEAKLHAVDDKMRLVAGARRRDRWVGILAVTCSRLNSMVLSLMILHAVGEPITLPFVAAWTFGSQAIYFASQLVPMGLGISEGGYYEMFRALGENPARGVTLVVARRTVHIMYALIGLVLVTTNETVKRAREVQVGKLEARPSQPLVVPPTSLPTPPMLATDEAD
jgi:hypothetical protein